MCKSVGGTNMQSRTGLLHEASEQIAPISDCILMLIIAWACKVMMGTLVPQCLENSAQYLQHIFHLRPKAPELYISN